MTLRK